MKYSKIDMDIYDRAEHYTYFRQQGTVIELTAMVDVSKALESCEKLNLSFQAFMLFLFAKTINSIKAFRLDVNDGDLILFEKIEPTFATFNYEKEIFSILCIELPDSLLDFDKIYKETVERYANSRSLIPQGSIPPNVFNVSCLPWLHYEHFSSTSKLSSGQMVKRITYGRYKQRGEQNIMPVTLQVSHAIADGYHVSQFFMTLQQELNKIQI